MKSASQPYETFYELLATSAERFSDATAYSIYSNEKSKWELISFCELYREAQQMAYRLQEAGLQAGDRVGLLGESSLEWIVTFYGTVLAGGVALPLDIKLGESELGAIIEHCEPHSVFVSESFWHQGQSLKFKSNFGMKILRLTRDWTPLFPAAASVDWGVLAKRQELQTRQELAVLCPTSGTLGNPKVVMISRRALLFEAHGLCRIKGCKDGEKVLFSILPLNHIYGLTAGLIYSLQSGFELCLADALTSESIRRSLRDRRAHHILAVPLYLMTVMNAIKVRVSDKGTLRKNLFELSLMPTRALPSVKVKQFIFKELHEAFGGQFEKFICGGAQIPPKVQTFFKSLGLPIFVGYGLTETGPVIAVNTDKFNRKGTVGRPLPGVEVQIADDGEILTRGPHLASGYWRDANLTDSTFGLDGWFRTGDIGHLDDDGYLSIIGRKKSMIVLANGKKIHPEEIEVLLSQSERIRFSCMIGMQDRQSGSEVPHLVVQPPEDLVLSHQGREAELTSDIEQEVEELLQKVADFKRPRKIHVWLSGMPITSSMKVRTNELKEELRRRSQ